MRPLPKYSRGSKLRLKTTSNSDDDSLKRNVFNEHPSDDFQSSLKAQLCRDPGFIYFFYFFYEDNHFTFMLEIPQMTMILPEPILC